MSVLAAEVLDAARRLGVRIVTAESCTGGMIAAALTDIPGSSDVFDRGFVTYSYASKEDMLGVDHAMLHANGAVSEPVARAMAEGALARSQAQVAVAVTGVAGPGGSEAKPEGLVWFALASAEATLSEKVSFGAIGRSQVRGATVAHALTLLYHWTRIQDFQNDA